MLVEWSCAVQRDKKGAGLLTRLEEMKAATAPVQPGGPGTVMPWDDAKVRDILGPAAEAANLRRRGLIFAMDATASRQPTWDRAIEVQASMFAAFSGGLQVQLVYFRGAEFHAGKWSRKPEEVAAAMRGVACRAGGTQIARVLAHSHEEAGHGGIAALVYVGDCMEESQPELVSLARKLGARGVKAFMFQDSEDPAVAASFREIAELTEGAYCRLGSQSAAELKELLRAAAAYAAGGKNALAQLAQAQPAARLLLTQMK
jgi:hypothetical protein